MRRTILTSIALCGLLPSHVLAATWYLDGDGDGVGRSTGAVIADDAPPDHVLTPGDCDDADPTQFPGNIEACDGKDNDCDELVDADDVDDLQPWYADRDMDGAGRPEAAPFRGCEGPAGRVANDDDCDDSNAARNPEAVETCNGIDDDCNGTVDDAPMFAITFYADQDEDGWGGRGGDSVDACDAPDGYVRNDLDCDDTDPVFHPYAFEACTPPFEDTNCDGATGDDVDNDSDGFPACRDCDDFESDTFPGATDTYYDGRIQDCDRASDYDRDGDGYDSDAWGGRDCDDLDAGVNPDGVEVPGNGVDEDCDGQDAAGSSDTGPLDTDEVIGPAKPGLGGCGPDGGCSQGGPSNLSFVIFALAFGRRRRAAAVRSRC